VVVCPVDKRAFLGAVGVGAFEIDEGGARKPLHVKATRELGEATCVVSRSHRGPEVDAILARLGCKALVPCGSAGIKAVRVATGETDLYVHPARAGMRWDTCAPEAIVRAAGGVLTDTAGNAYDYRSAAILKGDVVRSRR
jgi:3'(2'), 5'-bisphosphate nucleotidase